MDKLQVMIIDDDKDIAMFFSLALGLLGFECKLVHSAKDALVQLATSIPNLILLDLRLGSDIGGEDILYQIRSNPRFDNTRIVVITAYPRIAEMIANLADLVLIKPIEIDQLTTLISRMGSYEPGSRSSTFRDPITQLFNREFFITRLELAFNRAHRRREFLFAVVVIQVKLVGQEIIETGSEAWVAIQHEISERLRSHVRPMDSVAKLADWRFATLHEELNRPDDLQIILGRLQTILDATIDFQGVSYQMKAQFGTSLYNKYFPQPTDILEAAEKELEKAQAL